MKRLRLILILVAVILIGCLGVAVFSAKEPAYHGKSLTYWIYACNEGQQAETSAAAIRAIGTNALPTLLRMVTLKPHSLKQKIVNLVNGQKLIAVHWHTAEEQWDAALSAIRILGRDAHPLMADLIQQAKHPKAEIRLRAISALWNICLGDRKFIEYEKADVFPLLLNALNDPDDLVSMTAELAIDDCYPEDTKRKGVITSFERMRGWPVPAPATNAPEPNK